MTANAVKVLAPAYAQWFGEDAETAARLVVRHLSAGKPVPDAATLKELTRHFEHLNRSYISSNRVSKADEAVIHAHADELWQRMLRVSASHARFPLSTNLEVHSFATRPSSANYARLALGRLPWHDRVRAKARDFLQRPAVLPDMPAPDRLLETDYEPLPQNLDQPPTLYVVVDTEAEFDWDKPFARGLTGVTAMDEVERGQAVFDKYGLRPIYAVDYPVASQERSVSRLRAILDRGGCEIGAHLHPWTTPPFSEEVCNRNSYPGNLPAWMEDQKIAALVEMIRQSFGIDPLFYKAGRYGFGPATEEALARHGIKVDLSVMPGADLRREGGPDFRRLHASPYRIGHHGIVTVPMTRTHVGLVPSLGAMTETILQEPRLKTLRIQSVLSRLRIVDTITLTPEGVTAAEQIRLIKAMLKRGQRTFMMHYHSPSLSPGRTHYVRTEADARDFIARMNEVCRYFFETVGGLPGFPRDLVPVCALPVPVPQPALA